MSKKTMQELKDMLCLQLEDLRADAKKRGDITPTLLDAIHKVTDTIKNIDKIEMLSEDDDYSEARNRRYSRDNAKEEMMKELHEAMHKAETEKEKEIIRRTIDNLERM